MTEESKRKIEALKHCSREDNWCNNCPASAECISYKLFILAVAGHQMVQDASAMEITCQTDYENAGASLIKIKDQAKKIKDYWAEPKSKAKAAHQEIVDREKAMLSVLNEAEAIIKGAMRHYVDVDGF